MPGKVKVKIIAGRNLPVMDRGSDTTDAYVEIKLSSITHKTDVCRKSLNPQWNSEWYRFEVDDAELQDEPLQIRLMDYDTYSANDAIGKVNISLNPLLLPTIDTVTQTSHSGKGSVMSGWIPVFDTMHGIRGEVNLIVKVDLFSDVNKFRQSSCGVQFFHSPNIPHGYHAQIIHGFVEELVVNDDPEYQWIDKIRTPRASNEARQVVFLKLSGQVQRKIGLKAIDMGANAVIGYAQCFDLEGDVGVVARGIGTAVTLVKLHESISQPIVDNALVEDRTKKYLKFLACTNDSEINNISNINNSNKINNDNNLIKNNNNLINDNEQIKQILDLEDQRGEICNNLFKRKINNIKYTSKKLIKKRFNKIKTRLSNDDGGSKDCVDKKGSISDVSRYSITESARSSLGELKGLMKLGKRSKTHFQRSLSDGSGMAALLIRSIMTSPNTNLHAIAEAHDNTPKSSPNISTIGRKDDKIKKSVSLLDPKDNKLIKNSNISLSVGESESGSSIDEEDDDDEEEDDDDEDDDDEDLSEDISECINRDNVVPAPDTISMVVKTVLANEPELELEIDDDPNKLNTNQYCTILRTGSMRVTKDKNMNSQREIIENKIDPISIEKMLSSHRNDEDDDSEIWIEPGSTIDEPEITGERRNSMFKNIKDNISETFHHLHMPHLHEAKMHHGLLETAMQTMLAEKANICGAHLTQETLDENEKLEKEAIKRRSSLNSIKKKLHFNFDNPFHRTKSVKSPEPSEHDHDHRHDIDNKIIDIKNEDGLINTAMKTMLMDRMNIIEDINVDTIESSNSQYPSSIDVNLSNDSSNFLNNDKSFNINHNNDNKKYQMNKNINGSFSQNDLKLNYNIYDDDDDTSDIINTEIILPKSNGKTPAILLHKINDKHSSKSFENLLTNINYNNNNNNNNTNINKPMHVPSPFPFNRNEVQATSSTASGVGSTIVGATVKPIPGSSSIMNSSNLSATAPGGSTTHVISMNTNISVGHIRAESVGCKMVAQSPAKLTTQTIALPGTGTGIYRRSSDSDLSVTPKGNSLTTAERPATGILRMTSAIPMKIPLNDNIDMLEYPFLTITKFPQGFILHLGATVAARSVKLLERVPNPDEPETRDSWWTELRMEIRSHARALGCNVVLGYSEVTTISDDVCVLSATGTAAVMNLQYMGDITIVDSTTSLQRSNISTNSNKDVLQTSYDQQQRQDHGDKDTIGKDINKTPLKIIEISTTAKNEDNEIEMATFINKENNQNMLNASGSLHYHQTNINCSLCHIPYSQASVPFQCHMKKCAICKRGKVPDVLLSTIEIPDNLHITGRGCLVQAQVCRPKRDLRSESNAKEISDGLPFLEYELHRLLINKLKVKGMNAIFGLKATVAIGERMMALIATGTAVFLTALPPPDVPKIVAGNSWTDVEKLNELKRTIQETVNKNREIYQLKPIIEPDIINKPISSDTDDSDTDELIGDNMDLNLGNKDTCVLEIDDIEDLEVISLLMEQCPPDGFHIVNTQIVPGLHDLEVVKNLQMFTQVWRAKFPVNQPNSNFPKHFQRLLQTIYFKLRSMVPCAICDLRFRLDLPESEEIQLLVTGMALGLGESKAMNKFKRKIITHSTSKDGGKKLGDDELIFSLEEDPVFEMSQSQSQTNNLTTAGLPLTSSSAINLPTSIHGLQPPTTPSLQNHHFQQTGSLKLRNKSPLRNRSISSARTYLRHMPLRERYGVDITPLSYVPGGKIEKYLGNLNFFFIRESTSIRENGGISGFVHTFITELLAIVRAHVTALGGNAMISFYMTELLLVDNPHKNQGQCLISVGGDVVFVSYYNTQIED